MAAEPRAIKPEYAAANDAALVLLQRLLAMTRHDPEIHRAALEFIVAYRFAVDLPHRAGSQRQEA
jgi:hypothetical protein